MAVQAALGFKQRLRGSQARVGIGKAQGIVAGIQAARTNVGLVGKRRGGHAGNSCHDGLALKLTAWSG